MQLVFGRDAILNTKFEADWKWIKQIKQKRMKKNNERENKSRITHTYEKEQKVLFKEIEKNNFGNNPWTGPYVFRKVNSNQTVVMKMGSVVDTVNICLIKPYNE